MAKPLTDYLTKLHSDPKELTSFENDPDAAMKAAGVSAAHQQLLKSRDPKAIAAAVIDESPVAADAAGAFKFTWYIYIVIKF
jgi:hypothetical protein